MIKPSEWNKAVAYKLQRFSTPGDVASLEAQISQMNLQRKSNKRRLRLRKPEHIPESKMIGSPDAKIVGQYVEEVQVVGDITKQSRGALYLETLLKTLPNIRVADIPHVPR